jgi:large subunit ribosomal protein L9
MQIILLERVENLGQMGDVVTVKPGFARNFLLPRKKALRATKANISHFDAQKKVLEADNLKRKGEAEKVGAKLDGIKVVIIRSASEAGHLYGSVSGRDIADAVTAKGFKIARDQVRMETAYKALGLFPVKIDLHPEVMSVITINIARSAEEARIQEEKGVALVSAQREAEEKEAEAAEAQKAADKKAAAAAAKAEAAEGETAEEETEEAAA